jgi:hypothetical protein
MSARKATRQIGLIGLATLTVVAGQVAVVTDSAMAFMGYATGTVFGAPGSGNGQFASPTGVAVDDSSGDVYVVDQGNKRVQKFDAKGSYLSQFNGSGNPSFPEGFSSPSYIAVDNSSGVSKGDSYVVDVGHNVIDKFNSNGAFVFEIRGFANPVIGVAIDPSGDVWVAENGGEESGNVQEFDGAVKNVLIHSLTPAFKRNPGIAVDSQEDLYLVRGGEQPNAAKFNKEGATLAEQLTSCGCVRGLAVDLVTNDLFVDQGSSIARYGPFGEPYNSPPETLEGISSSKGVAVDGATHTVYASQQEANTVAIFKFVLLPDVTTGPVSEVQRNGAKLEGIVNPDGQQVTACQFEYGATTAYGQTASCVPIPGSGSSSVAVSAQAGSLTAGSTYHYRLVATNTNGANHGADGTFTTKVAVEGVKTGEASEVQSTSATLKGSLEPNGNDTHYLFQYGPCATLAACAASPYVAETTSTDAGSATEDKLTSTAVSALRPNQAYRFRVVAENAFGTTSGEERTFATPIVGPQTAGQPSASFITTQSAVLSALLNPEHVASRYHFEYGPCPTLVGCATIRSTSDNTSSVYGVTGSTQEISGLAPGTVYSYRLVASNEFEEEGKMFGGRATGAESTFTTAPAPLPSAQTGGYGAVTPTSAVVSGLVNPDGLPAGYEFELGVYSGANIQYAIVSSGSAGSSGGPVEEMLALTGLQPATTYAYRIAISSGYIANESHTLQGAPVTFTTAGISAVLMSPVPLPMLAVPPIAFPAESKVLPPPSKCKRGFARDRHGKCVRLRHKKVGKARKKGLPA